MRAAWLLTVGLLFGSAIANADADGDRCGLDAARQLRNAGKLHDALRALDDCSGCERVAMCEAAHASLRAAMPTVVVSVRDVAGHVVVAKLSIDERPARPDETTELDPGTHQILVDGGDRPIERTVDLDEHDRLQLEILLPARRADATTGSSTPVPTRRPAPASVWILGGSALAALAVSNVMLVVGLRDQGAASSYADALRARDELFTSGVFGAVGVSVLLATMFVAVARAPAPRVTVGASGLSMRF